MSLIPPIEYAPDNCFICKESGYGLTEVTTYYDKDLYNILEDLYGENKLKDKNICNKCILKIYQYNVLEKISDKLEEIYMSI